MNAIKFFSEWADVPLEDAEAGYGAEYVEMIEEFAKLEVISELEDIYKMLKEKISKWEEILDEQADKASILSKIGGLQGIAIEIQTRMIHKQGKKL